MNYNDYKGLQRWKCTGNTWTFPHKDNFKVFIMPWNIHTIGCSMKTGVVNHPTTQVNVSKPMTSTSLEKLRQSQRPTVCVMTNVTSRSLFTHCMQFVSVFGQNKKLPREKHGEVFRCQSRTVDLDISDTSTEGLMQSFDHQKTGWMKTLWQHNSPVEPVRLLFSFSAYEPWEKLNGQNVVHSVLNVAASNWNTTVPKST